MPEFAVIVCVACAAYSGAFSAAWLHARRSQRKEIVDDIKRYAAMHDRVTMADVIQIVRGEHDA